MIAAIEASLDALVAAAEPVRHSFRWRPVLSDPSDAMVLKKAINGSADVLVTFNHRHYRRKIPQTVPGTSGPSLLCSRFRFLTIEVYACSTQRPEGYMTARTIGWGLVLLCSTGCAAPSTPDAQDRTEVEAAVRAAADSVIASANGADLDGVLRFLSDGPESLSADNGRMLERDELSEAFRPGFAALRSQDIRMTRSEVYPLSDDVVVMMAEGTFTATDTTGTTSALRPFAWTFVWFREPAGWKARWTHQSFGPPVPQ